MLLSDSVREQHEQGSSLREDQEGPKGATSRGSARTSGMAWARWAKLGGGGRSHDRWSTRAWVLSRGSCQEEKEMSWRQEWGEGYT